MRLTIVPEDGKVNIDGIYREKLNLTTCDIPLNVHALQWYDTRGWIEINPVDPFALKPENEYITELPAWAMATIAVAEAAT